MTSELGHLEAVLPKVQALRRGVRPEQLTLPTPCVDFNVQQLLDHLDEWVRKYAVQATGQAVAPDTSFDEAAEQVLRGLREKLTPEPPSVGMLLLEYITHGWDLATATSQAVPFTDEEVGVALAFGKQMLKPEYRGPGQPFGLEVAVPEEAAEIERLAAFMGRQPK